MEAKKVVIDDLHMSKEDSKALLLEMISQQINQCKTQYHAKWLKDHTISRDETNKNIARLRAKREEIEKMFDQIPSDDGAVNISFSINVTTADKKMVETLVYS